jgi:hypothetical protein
VPVGGFARSGLDRARDHAARRQIADRFDLVHVGPPSHDIVPGGG